MKHKKKYLITTSLLNSWDYLLNVDEQYYEKSFEEFKGTLRREKFEPNVYMQAGLDFEDDAIAGKVKGISEIIKGGSFQLRATKEVEVGERIFLIYGRIDVLKAGTIYDIKFVNNASKFEVGRFFNSFQHHTYMDIIPEAKDFKYLIGMNSTQAEKRATGEDYIIFEEVYDRSECQGISFAINHFINWLIQHNLLGLYEEHWEAL